MEYVKGRFLLSFFFVKKDIQRVAIATLTKVITIRYDTVTNFMYNLSSRVIILKEIQPFQTKCFLENAHCRMVFVRGRNERLLNT